MATTILIVALIILLCVVLNKISSKIGVPILLGFILLGMVFGTDGIFKIEFDNYVIVEKVCSIALVFIIFYGGFGTKWSKAKPIAVKAALLSTLGVLFTAALTGLFCFWVLGIGLLESFLIGAVISSTDAASVFSILRSKKLGLKYNSASLLEVESGSNDPCSYMLTVIILSIMGGNVDSGNIAFLVFAQFFYGIVIGGVIAWSVLWILRRFHFESAGFDMVFMIGIALLSYALPTLVGGNGYLSVYIVGIVIGNGNIQGKQSLVHFFDGITGLMQMLIFFLLGLLATPSSMTPILIPALLIALFITFVARPIAVFAILTPAKCTLPQQILVSFAGLRGAASIVFAIIATVDDAYMQHDVFHIVFCIVLFSILFQGTFISLVAKKLNMIDEKEDVFQTFNDYSNESSLHFIKLEITQTHPWKNAKVKNLELPADALLVLVLRDKKPILPNTETELLPGDIAVLSVITSVKNAAARSIEKLKASNDQWGNETVSDLSTDPKELILMIKHDNQMIVLGGNTVIDENDIIVLNASQDKF